MATADLSSYKTLYIQTAKEYVNKISVSLDKLSSNVLDKDALNNLHIASHSLKSQSQVMGFIHIANLCLSIEKTSNEALKGNSQLIHKDISDIKQAVDEISLKLAQIEQTS